MNKSALTIALLGCLTAGFMNAAQADKLDDIIDSGKLRCAVTLDFPPMGMRDDANNPVGFDVDYCNDLAKVLGVTAEIVETPFPDRIPALVSNRADIIVASTSDTLERAKTVAMTIPYFVFSVQVMTHEGTNINKFEDLKGHTLAATTGSYEANALSKTLKEWGTGTVQTYQSQNDTLLAVSQGHVDATIVTSAVGASAIKSGKYKGLKLAGNAPYTPDYRVAGGQAQRTGPARLPESVHQPASAQRSLCRAVQEVAGRRATIPHRTGRVLLSFA